MRNKCLKPVKGAVVEAMRTKKKTAVERSIKWPFVTQDCGNYDKSSPCRIAQTQITLEETRKKTTRDFSHKFCCERE